MKEVITKDGSITFFNEQFQEHYHSTAGAHEETLKKFAMPLEPYLPIEGSITVLDVCFGLGYTSAAFVEYYASRYTRITIECLEIDKAIVEKIPSIQIDFACYPLFQRFVEALKNNKLTYTEHFQNTEVFFHMHWGDARETIQQISQVHAVLFDPFSPKKHPELWSESFLKAVQLAMLPGSALTTYSCARSFRDALRALNFEVINGPCIGRRAPSTIAVNKAMK